MKTIIISIALMFISSGIAIAGEHTVYDLDSGELRHFGTRDGLYGTHVHDHETGKNYDVKIDKHGYGTIYDIKSGNIKNFHINKDSILDMESGKIYHYDD